MSSRLAFGSILNTVTSTAAALTNTVDTANAGIGMLSAFVTKAAEEQQVRHIADKEDFLETLIRDKAQQRATSTLQVQKFCAKSADHKEFYSDAYSAYSKLLRKDDE